MKILKRIFFGLLFIPWFLVTLLFTCPISWIFFGDFDYKMHELIDFYQNL